MSQQPERVYEFGPFRLHVVKRLLVREGEVMPVTSKVFDLLLLLVEHGGRVVHKDEMMSALWPDTAVEENNLTQQISALRKVLGESAREHRFVVTVPGRGYSFVADVRESREDPPDPTPGQHTRSLVPVAAGAEGDRRSGTLPAAAQRFLPAAPSRAGLRPRVYLTAMVFSGLLIGLAAMFADRRPEAPALRPSTGAAPRSIAVLPFRSLNAKEGEDFFGPGMTDTLIAKLSNVRQINVRPTSSVLKYAGATPDSLAAGRELGVDSVLEGTVQRSGDRVRVTVQLLSVRDGAPLWAESFDEKLDDLFAVQDAISEQVAQATLTRLNGDDQRRLRKRHTESVEAYQAYLRGRYFWNKRSAEGVRRAIEYFRRAIELDPNYALAHAGLADAYYVLVGYGFDKSSPEAEGVRAAREAAERALELDETLAEAHTSLASLKFYRDADAVGAEREYRRAIELNPNYATAHHWYSDFLAMTGRPAEAMGEIRRAQEIDPLSSIIGTTLGERLYYERRYDEAVAQLRRTLEIEPDFFLARAFLGMAYERKGMYAEAIAELRRARELSGGGTGMTAALGHTYAISGKRREALTLLGELLKLEDVRPFEVATVYVGLGEKRQAIKWLQKISREEAAWRLKTDPRFDRIRSDPDFQNLLRAAET